MTSYLIRKAVPVDAEKILEIYAPYIEKTAVSFEYDVPSTVEFQERMQSTMERYPYLVAVDDKNTVLGYAYASDHMHRKAYQWNAALSVYIAEEHKGKGIGSSLYRKLFALLQKQGFVNAYACIVYPYEESEKFHEKLGFQKVGHFLGSGYKHGQWHDIIWMEKPLSHKKDAPKEVIPFGALTEEIMENILMEE